MAHTADRRIAARANQRAAAFIRFQMLGDHEAMWLVMNEAVGGTNAERLAFMAALASIAGNLATVSHGRDEALRYFEAVAVNSGVMSDDPDIDRHFDGS